ESTAERQSAIAGVGQGVGDLVDRLRDALTHLDDLAYLQAHPLARLAAAAEVGSANPGRALRRSLLEAIDSLRPPPATADGHAARGHRILTRRYVDGRDVGAVQRELAISHSEYYRDHRRALAAGAAFLCARWGLAAAGPAGP